MYYWEDKKTKELKLLYEEKDKWAQERITIEAEYTKQKLIL